MITGIGWTYNKKTRQITFGKIPCWQCKSTGKIKHHNPCPRDGRKQHGKPCPYCGSKSSWRHLSTSYTIIDCPKCDGMGSYVADHYDSLDLRPLAQYVKFTIGRVNRTANFNESYLGIGTIAGVTDYGRYIERNQHNPDAIFEDLVDEIVKDAFGNNGIGRQSGNLISADNKLIPVIFITCRSDGWTASAPGSKFSRTPEQTKVLINHLFPEGLLPA